VQSWRTAASVMGSLCTVAGSSGHNDSGSDNAVNQKWIFRLTAMTNRLCETLLNGFFPGRCLCCELPSGRALDLCAACEAELPTLGNHCQICAEPLPVQGICGHCLDAPPDFCRILAPFRYASPLSELITAL